MEVGKCVDKCVEGLETQKDSDASHALGDKSNSFHKGPFTQVKSIHQWELAAGQCLPRLKLDALPVAELDN